MSAWAAITRAFTCSVEAEIGYAHSVGLRELCQDVYETLNECLCAAIGRGAVARDELRRIIISNLSRRRVQITPETRVALRP